MGKIVPKCRLTPTAKRALAGAGLTREGLIKAHAAIVWLPEIAEELRQSARLKTPPNTFLFSHLLLDAGRAWNLCFCVDDSDWPTRLLVLDVIATGGEPWR
jgi:hypothetical protein